VWRQWNLKRKGINIISSFRWKQGICYPTCVCFFLHRVIDLNCWIFIQRSSFVSYSSFSSCHPDFVSVYWACTPSLPPPTIPPPLSSPNLVRTTATPLPQPGPTASIIVRTQSRPTLSPPSGHLPSPGPLLFLRSLDLGEREEKGTRFGRERDEAHRSGMGHRREERWCRHGQVARGHRCVTSSRFEATEI
jgi:hypothetical protein